MKFIIHSQLSAIYENPNSFKNKSSIVAQGDIENLLAFGFKVGEPKESSSGYLVREVHGDNGFGPVTLELPTIQDLLDLADKRDIVLIYRQGEWELDND